MQKLADQLVGDEDRKQFIEKQLQTEVLEQFSGIPMALERILVVRRKLFEWHQQGLAKVAASLHVNQVVISNPVHMKPVHALNCESLKKLEQEFHIANASAPVNNNMEQAK